MGRLRLCQTVPWGQVVVGVHAGVQLVVACERSGGKGLGLTTGGQWLATGGQGSWWVGGIGSGGGGLDPGPGNVMGVSKI